MSDKPKTGRDAAIHHNDNNPAAPSLKDNKGPGKQHPAAGDQGPHGGGEGETGMQPGAGHPRGR